MRPTADRHIGAKKQDRKREKTEEETDREGQRDRLFSFGKLR